WLIPSRAISRITIQARMDIGQLLQWARSRPTDMASSIWLAMSGSGLQIGIDRTITRPWLLPAKLPSIQKDLLIVSIPVSRGCGSVYTGEAHFFAPINTVHVTSQADAAKECPTPEQITSASAAPANQNFKRAQWLGTEKTAVAPWPG